MNLTNPSGEGPEPSEQEIEQFKREHGWEPRPWETGPDAIPVPSKEEVEQFRLDFKAKHGWVPRPWEVGSYKATYHHLKEFEKAMGDQK